VEVKENKDACLSITKTLVQEGFLKEGDDLNLNRKYSLSDKGLRVVNRALSVSLD
jgi:predicted transcriptional regulator